MSVPPNFNDPNLTRGPLLIGTSIGLFILSTLVFFLRVYSRKVIFGKICAEEYLITSAWIINIFFTVYAVKAAQWGFGRKMQDYPPEWLPHMLMNCFVFGILYQPALAFTKVSILLFFTRFAPTETFKKICYGAMSIVVLSSLPFVLAAIFGCKPIEASWKPITTPGVVPTCIDLVKMSRAGAISNSLTDAIMLCLPLPMVWKLRVSLRKKLAVCALFSLGGFVLGVSLVRVGLVYNTNQDKEYFWDGALSATWSVVEVNTIIICACLPAIRHLIFKRFGSNNKHHKKPAGANNDRVGGDGLGFGGAKGKPKALSSDPELGDSSFWTETGTGTGTGMDTETGTGTGTWSSTIGGGGTTSTTIEMERKKDVLPPPAAKLF